MAARLFLFHPRSIGSKQTWQTESVPQKSRENCQAWEKQRIDVFGNKKTTSFWEELMASVQSSCVLQPNCGLNNFSTRAVRWGDYCSAGTPIFLRQLSPIFTAMPLSKCCCFLLPSTPTSTVGINIMVLGFWNSPIRMNIMDFSFATASSSVPAPSFVCRSSSFTMTDSDSGLCNESAKYLRNSSLSNLVDDSLKGIGTHRLSGLFCR